MKEFSYRTRIDNIKKLKEQEFDLLIIGGGINGAGVARDAASRGMKVALVEAQDFAEGTSSRSSKLIHGGVRYLENMEFSLVFEALSERKKLFEIAPHLVHPLRFVIPIFDSSRVGMWIMGLGMWAYDALSLFQAPELHERLSALETMERLPLLSSRGLKGSYVYSDAYMDDDRLVIETLRSANELGATLVNHVRAEGVELEEGQIKNVTVKDQLNGQSFQVKAKHTISTVGVWTDQLGESFFPNTWNPIMRPSKGVHLTFLREKMPIQQAVVMGVESRIVFAIPRKEMVIIGTTDTDYVGMPGQVKTLNEDVEYLLKVANEYFSGAQLNREDIIGSYAGVRPLVDDGAETEGKTSREHSIISDPRNMTFVAGGKYTTYRLIAEEAVDSVLETFPIEYRAGLGRSQTKSPLSSNVSAESLIEAQTKVIKWAEVHNKSKQWALNLAERHGLEAQQLLEKYGDLLNESEESLWMIEAYHAAEKTMCLRFKDFILRRTPLFLSKRDHGESFYSSCLEAMAQVNGWNLSEKQEQFDVMQQFKAFELSWKSNLSD